MESGSRSPVDRVPGGVVDRWAGRLRPPRVARLVDRYGTQLCCGRLWQAASWQRAWHAEYRRRARQATLNLFELFERRQSEQRRGLSTDGVGNQSKRLQRAVSLSLPLVKLLYDARIGEKNSRLDGHNRICKVAAYVTGVLNAVHKRRWTAQIYAARALPRLRDVACGAAARVQPALAKDGDGHVNRRVWPIDVPIDLFGISHGCACVHLDIDVPKERATRDQRSQLVRQFCVRILENAK